MVQILTHPNNKDLIESVVPKLEEKEYHPIHYSPMGLGKIPIIFDSLIPETKPSKDHFEDVERNKFCTYSTYKPKDWEVYFGFVKALPEPNFIMMDDHYSRIDHRMWMDLECSSNLPTTVYAKEQETPARPSVSSLTLEANKRQLLQLGNSIIMRGTS
jgi:hypothetical protein